MAGDPLPNMTAQERAIWERVSAGNPGAAGHALVNNGAGHVRNLIDQEQRAIIDRANEGGRDR